MQEVKDAIYSCVAQDLELFRAVSVELPDEEEVAALIQLIQREMKEKDEKLIRGRWDLLTSLLRSPSFAIAVLSQALPTSYLAVVDIPGMRTEASRLEGMPRAEFVDYITNRHEKHKDPEVSTPEREHIRDTQITTPAPAPTPTSVTTPKPSEEAQAPSMEKAKPGATPSKGTKSVSDCPGLVSMDG